MADELKESGAVTALSMTSPPKSTAPQTRVSAGFGGPSDRQRRHRHGSGRSSRRSRSPTRSARRRRARRSRMCVGSSGSARPRSTSGRNATAITPFSSACVARAAGAIRRFTLIDDVALECRGGVGAVRSVCHASLPRQSMIGGSMNHVSFSFHPRNRITSAFAR
jgi:hypothetical protein